VARATVPVAAAALLKNDGALIFRVRPRPRPLPRPRLLSRDDDGGFPDQVGNGQRRFVEDGNHLRLLAKS
jgi:hypothetical protein